MATDFKIPVFNGLDSMFNTSNDNVSELRIAEIDDFAGHTFSVIDNDDMTELVESIKANGVITPVLVRQKENNRYELVSGHRRRRAATLAGLVTIPAVIRNLTDDEAIIAMVDANLQREKLLPSEKARSYKARLEAIKRQSGTTCPTEGRSSSKVGEVSGESYKTVQRYIRLNYLIGELLELVDEEKIKIIPAVELSFLNSETQISLYDAMLHKNKKSVSLKEAKTVRSAAEGKYLTIDEVISVLWPEKTAPDPKDTEEDEEPTEEESKDNLPKIPSHLLHYFASGISTELMWQKIERLLKDDAELKEAGIDLD